MPTKAIYLDDKAKRDGIFAWARYVFWTDIERGQLDAHEPAVDEPPTGMTSALMAQYFAALWVSIEGWRECQLTDPTVDELLTHPAFARNLALLRRFRNGVYHFQKGLVNTCLLEFIRHAATTVPWSFLVHEEFKRVLWEIVSPKNVPSDLQEKVVEGFRHIVGWLPSGIIEAYPSYAAKQYQEVANMVLTSPRRDTQEAKNLLALGEEFRSMAHQTESDWTGFKRALIEALKKGEDIGDLIRS
jgi:hypothetical protein